jgi:hypothetical protein
MNAVKSILSRAIQRRGLILERRAGDSFSMKKRGFRVEVTLLHAEPRYIALALHLPVLGEVCLHLDVRGSDKAGFQIACEDDVLLLRSEKEHDQEVPGKRPA